MRSIRLAVAALFAAGLLATPVIGRAQTRPYTPKRPALDGADTNSSQAYYNDGIKALDYDPDRAAADFYWSTQLNPMFAEAYYAERVALHLTMPRRLYRYWDGEKNTLRSPEVRQIDSLYLRALTMNPFLSQRLEGSLWRAVRKIDVDEISDRYHVSGPEVEYYLNTEIKDWPASSRAWLAYVDGDYPQALEFYAKAIDEARDDDKGWLRNQRARLYAQMDKPDSAIADLKLAVAEQRKQDEKDLVFVYQSKALTEEGLGVLQNRLGHVAEAREAFSKALEEDISYYPAHMQLAYLALDQKDTATALNELDLATQIRGDDAGVRYMYGFILNSVGKYDDAIVQLKKASELDPYFALPYRVVSDAYRGKGDAAGALGALDKFIAYSSKDDVQRAEAIAIADELRPIVQAGAAKP